MTAYRTNARSRDEEAVRCIVNAMVLTHLDARMLRAGPRAHQQGPVAGSDRALYAAAIDAMKRLVFSDAARAMIPGLVRLR